MPSHSRAVKGRIYDTAASFTRPSDTTAYASGDLVANSTTAASVVALSWSLVGQGEAELSGFVRKVRMHSSNTSTTNASFRVHFYKANPVASAPTNGDNGAYAVAAGNDNYLGAVDTTFDRTINNGKAYGSGVPGTGAEMNFTGVSTLYALIEARAAYTPASGEVFTVVPEIHLY